jgi:nucleoside-diphosphate-sugar epimerase
MRTQHVDPPGKNVPLAVAKAVAGASERIWGALGRRTHPPLTRFTVWVSALECTIDDSRARRELGYSPVKSREEGLAELRTSGV